MGIINRRDILRLAAVGSAAGLTNVMAAQDPTSSGECSGNKGDKDRGKDSYIVLSCDGGGIRGILTALIIQELDKRLGFLKCVDLFAGTSTGGVIALALAHNVPIRDLVELYRSKGKTIFQPYRIPEGQFEIVRKAQAALALAALKWEAIGTLKESLNDFFHVKYDNKNLEEVLKPFFAENLTLADLKRQVLVTTFRLKGDDEQGWGPVALHNLQTPNPETRVIEAALCTSAAPLYFPPVNHRKLGYCVDGGIFANSPGALTLASLVQAKHRLSSIRMLSIGTGVTRSQMSSFAPFLQYGDFGIGAWLSPVAREKKIIPPYPLLAALFDGTSMADVLVCQQLLDSDKYLRVQVPLEKPIPLDAYDQVDQLETEAKQFFKREGEKITKWVNEHYLQ